MISEKIVYSIIVSIFSLCVSFLLIEKILSLIFGYDSDYYNELQSPPILNSILFYFLSTAFGVVIFEIWLRNCKSIC